MVDFEMEFQDRLLLNRSHVIHDADPDIQGAAFTTATPRIYADARFDTDFPIVAGCVNHAERAR